MTWLHKMDKTIVLLLAAAACCFAPRADAYEDRPRPNILWLSAEDISPHLGCYGYQHAITPNLDQLAAEEILFTHAFTTAGVCAPCRSGIITGMYQTSIGTHNMRCQARLPDFIRPFPVYLREAGYYTANNYKEDYQFVTPPETWDDSSPRAHWRNRKSTNQPFFAVFNFNGCHESGIARTEKYRFVTAHLLPSQRQQASALTTLPPYYPDTPKTREDWKRYYELITAMDVWAGKLIDQLKEDGLYENTIIMFWSDHGVGLPRAKRWLYDSGTHIPLIVRIPAKFRTPGQGGVGSTEDRLVSSIDFGPTVLNLAGIRLPTPLQGQPFLGANRAAPREYVYGARDRMDERYDIIRMVRDKRFKYLRNYEPWKPYYQYMNTPEKGATMIVLRRLHDAGRLAPVADRYFNAPKPIEELYDTKVDPFELTNLAGERRYADILQKMRQAHQAWTRRTRDLGLMAEPILAERELAIGHRYGILRQKDGDDLCLRLTTAAVSAAAGKSALPRIRAAIHDQDAAVRYWGAIGFGNLGHLEPDICRQLLVRLADKSGAVRIAAARALCRSGRPEPSLPHLANALIHGSQWERLLAAEVLDEIGQQAAPLRQAMHGALRPQKQLYAGGKYTVRLINHALNQLEGTHRVVK